MHFSTLHRESGKRDSNPRPQPWQGCALPTELFPQTLLPFRTATTPHVLRTKRVRTTAAVLGRIHGDGGEGNRTPDLVNAIHALSQLSYAPGDGRVRCEKKRIPSGTAKYSHVYIACQRNGTSENICGQYFAAPSGVVADLETPPLIPRDFAVANHRRCDGMHNNRRRS
jgi:hypothetical protein